MDTYIKDGNNNRASVSFWGGKDHAQASLDSLTNCTNCTDCWNCTDCMNCSGIMNAKDSWFQKMIAAA